MTWTKVKYRDWTFEVDLDLTRQTYEKVAVGGAESCICNDCKNYVAYRDSIFSNEIRSLFDDLGIDYKKDVEIVSYETLPDGMHRIGGWFHFKGRVLSGKDHRVQLPGGGYSIELTPVFEDFSIGFSEGADLTFFSDKNGLVQVEFITNIPWVIDKFLETK